MRNIILKILFIITVIWSSSSAQMIPDLGGQRVGISSLQFMKIGVGARGTAMGEAMVAVANDVSALFWNPAGLVLSGQNEIMIAHAEWLVELKHDFVGATYNLSDADVVGLSLISLATDDMPITTEIQPKGTGAYFRYSDLAIGISYARKMTSQFSFGATIRYVQENLDVLKIKTMLFDLGTYYTLGIGSLRIGVVITNFGSDVRPEGNIVTFDGSSINSFQSFSPPTVFKVGLAFEPFRDDVQRVTTSFQLNHPNDNAENMRFGCEYAWNEWLMLRAGVKRTIGEPFFGKDRKSADDYSFGIGVKTPLVITTAMFDYSYTNFNQLGAVHRISLNLTY